MTSKIRKAASHIIFMMAGLVGVHCGACRIVTLMSAAEVAGLPILICFSSLIHSIISSESFYVWIHFINSIIPYNPVWASSPTVSTMFLQLLLNHWPSFTNILFRFFLYSFWREGSTENVNPCLLKWKNWPQLCSQIDDRKVRVCTRWISWLS